MWDTPMANVSLEDSCWPPFDQFSHKSEFFHELGPTTLSTTSPAGLFHPPSIPPTPDPFTSLFQDLPPTNMLTEKKLHWTQRVALIRHNLHAASRTGDFTFFKTLQAHRLLEGTDHLAALSAVIGDAADQVLASLDNYNSVMAYVHEDAFKNVYESVKTGVREQSGSYDDRRAIYYVDAAQQKEKAEKAIDKMINSAITMINAQPVNCQEEAANVWIWGTTFVADAMEVCLAQIDAIEVCLDDFIRLENAWSVVQSAVGASIGAIKGIFNLMAPCEAASDVVQAQHRSEATEGTVRSMLRRMSTAMTGGMGGSSGSGGGGGGSTAPSRRQSVMSVSSMPPPPPHASLLQHGSIQTTGMGNGPIPFRNTLGGHGGSGGGGLGSGGGWRTSALKHSKGPMELMPTIPPTPAAAMLNTNPFDSSFSGSSSNFSVGEDVPPPPTAPPHAHFNTNNAPPASTSSNSNNTNNASVHHLQKRTTSAGASFAGGLSSNAINTTNNNSNNSADLAGSPGSTITTTTSASTTNGTGNSSSTSGGGGSMSRPRSANVQDPRPVFDDVMFSMQQDDPLAEGDAHMSGMDFVGIVGGGGNGGFLRRLSAAFAPSMVVN